jgi:hypothetical protein
MTNPQPHPADQTVVPGHEFRNAAAAPVPPVTAAQANSVLMDEIHLLRERGLSDECIHGLFSGFNIDARPEPSGQHWKLPLNDQLIRLIWGKINSTPLTLD